MKRKFWTSALGCFVGFAAGSALAVWCGMAEFSPRLKAAIVWSEVRSSEGVEFARVRDPFLHASSSPSALLLVEMLSLEAEASTGQIADPAHTCFRLKISHCDLQRLRGALASPR